MSRQYFCTNINAVADLARYPELIFLDHYDMLIPAVLACMLYGSGSALKFVIPSLNTSGPQMLVWGFFISTVALFHGTFTINSLSHLIGRQRFKTGDESRNSLLLALITFGEWHNNHHYYPTSARQGFRWWEPDCTYMVLALLSILGLIWDLKTVPEHVAYAAGD